MWLVLVGREIFVLRCVSLYYVLLDSCMRSVWYMTSLTIFYFNEINLNILQSYYFQLFIVL